MLDPRSLLTLFALMVAVASSDLVSAPDHAVAAAAPAAAYAQPLALPVVVPVVDCARLRTEDVSAVVGAATRVESAAIVSASGTAAYCNVKVVVDDYARFELHLPQASWTQRLLFGGGPGAQTSSGMKLDQFATVSWEDLGRRNDEDLLANDPQAQINAGYRGMHLQVLAAKALIQHYYGRKPRFSYYNACSNPAREGMIEAERFPQDFDGIGAGCPPINITVNNGLWHAWNVLTNTGPDGKAIITADKLPILHQAVLRQCDALDGATDGIVSAPQQCHPDFSSVECKPGADPKSCVTAAQIHVALELYHGAHDAAGRLLTPGGVMPGSELSWTATIVPGDRGGQEEARRVTEKAIRSHFNYPALPQTWKLAQLRFDRATFDATTSLRFIHDGTDTDLSAYARAGHKLMMWMSLDDTNVLPAQNLIYYQALQHQLGTRTVNGFVRFYLLPGVYHCGGGDGPVIGNLLEPLMAWVERGIAPGVLEGVHVPRPAGFGPPPKTNSAPDLTRPIYPYPYTARYIGKGDVRSAANYVRGPALPLTFPQWAGSGFFGPNALKWCTAAGKRLDCTLTRH